MPHSQSSVPSGKICVSCVFAALHAHSLFGGYGFQAAMLSVPLRTRGKEDPLRFEWIIQCPLPWRNDGFAFLREDEPELPCDQGGHITHPEARISVSGASPFPQPVQRAGRLLERSRNFRWNGSPLKRKTREVECAPECTPVTQSSFLLLAGSASRWGSRPGAAENVS